MQLTHIIALAGLVPTLVSARVTKVRRGVECYFSAAADSSTSTCQTFADHWFITLADFQRVNPGAKCPSLDIDTQYCVYGDVTPEVSVSSSSIPPTTLSSSSSLSTTSWTQTSIVVSPTSSTATSTTSSSTIQPYSTSSPSPSVSPLLPGVASNCNRFYKIVSGDECDIVAAKNGITTAQLRSWNEINTSCSNLWLDYYVCVGVPGVVPSPTTTSTTSSAPSPTVSPVMPGYASNCNRWDKVRSGDQCDTLAGRNGISVTQLRNWNTQINAQCNNLWLDYYVCVGIPGVTPSPTTSTTPSVPTPTVSPVMPGYVSNCDRWDMVRSGDQCDIIASRNRVTTAELRTWNTQINAGCSNLWLGYYICVGVPAPSPVMPGLAGTCNRWHLVASGDQCDNIASRYGITLAQFKSWNTQVNAACSNLWLGYYVCTRTRA
ncbi:LysM domain-containing protein [Triangularia verruculosa]|uniref:LysM domain-containing protein n=1 Tax=Triangularia verruculosa TaxID=2587418 RepID=A0AAN7AR15_9PEZI|nr:LysM domain-containing protein [Triangularia verruculosa]